MENYEEIFGLWMGDIISAQLEFLAILHSLKVKLLSRVLRKLKNIVKLHFLEYLKKEAPKHC